MRGQVVPMEEMFSGLKLGLIVAVIAIFLLLAANFQSFRLSLAVVSIPAILIGIALPYTTLVSTYPGGAAIS